MKRLLTVVLCGLVACSDITAGSELTMSLTVSPAQINPGQEMVIQLLVHNSSAEPKQIVIDPCVPNFEILKDGIVVGPGPRSCSLANTIVQPITLSTGSEVRIDETWGGEASSTTSTGDPTYLTPGVYKLRPRTMLFNDGWVYGQAISVTVKPDED